MRSDPLRGQRSPASSLHLSLHGMSASDRQRVFNGAGCGRHRLPLRRDPAALAPTQSRQRAHGHSVGLPGLWHVDLQRPKARADYTRRASTPGPAALARPRASGTRPGSSIMLPTHHRAAKGAHEGHVRLIGVETPSLRSLRIPEGVVTHPSEPQQKPSVSARYGPLGPGPRRKQPRECQAAPQHWGRSSYERFPFSVAG